MSYGSGKKKQLLVALPSPQMKANVCQVGLLTLLHTQPLLLPFPSERHVSEEGSAVFREGCSLLPHFLNFSSIILCSTRLSRWKRRGRGRRTNSSGNRTRLLGMLVLCAGWPGGR